MKQYFVDIKRFALLCLLCVVALANVAFAQVGGDSAVVEIGSVQVDGLRFHYTDTTHLANFVICSRKVTAKKPIDYDFNKMELIPSAKRMKRQATRKYYYPGSLVFNLRRGKSDKIEITASRLNYNVNENSAYNIKYSNCEIGMVRYNVGGNGAKRIYNRCTLYLNNADDARYYIDNHAEYTGCKFIPCNDRMYIGFYGSDNDVRIRNCTTTRKGRLFYRGHADNTELNSYSLKGSANL